MSTVDPFAPPSTPGDPPDRRLPASKTRGPNSFDQFSLEPSGGPDLIPGTQRDPSVAAVRSRQALPGFGVHNGVSGPELRTRPRRLSKSQVDDNTWLPPSGRPTMAPRPGVASLHDTTHDPAPGSTPASLAVPTAASRELLVGLDAFDDFEEDHDIPLVGNGPKWPEPPQLDREGNLVAFHNRPKPVKWGWAEAWTSPPPQQWRTVTDGELDEAPDEEPRHEQLAGFGSVRAGDDSAPTTQSPLGRLRGRREFAADDAKPDLDVPVARSFREGDLPRRIPPVPIGPTRAPQSRNIGDTRAPTEPAVRDIRPVRRDEDGSPRLREVPGAALTRPGLVASRLPTQTAPPLPATKPTTPWPGTEINRPDTPARNRRDAPSRDRTRRDTPGRDRPAIVRPDGDDEDDAHPERRRNWLAFIGLSVLFALLLQNFVLQANSIPSTSMSPTLIIDDYVLVNKLSYTIGGPSRGDVVVFDRPESVPSEDDVFIKRVVGLPGETVTFSDGKVVIDGEPLEETYTASPESSFPLVDQIPGCGPPRPDGGCVVPDDSIFVMGDNRRNSSDSRRFGPVKVDTIAGRAFMRTWPSSRIGGL